jgi:SSS family solute:Na+ symporter
MAVGMWMLYLIPNAATKHAHFGGSAFPLAKWFDPGVLGLAPNTSVYVGFIAVLINIAVAALVTLALGARRSPAAVVTPA